MQANLFDKTPDRDPDDIVWFGSSSFSDKDWVGPFYPSGTKPADFLSYYATHYRTVEIDATYYAVPSRNTVRGWYDKVPEGFLFAAKFPKDIVHCGEGPKPDGDKILDPEATYPVRDAFLEAMHLLGGKAGPLLIQFPYLAKDVFPSTDAFLERLDRFLEDLPRDFEFAVEIRNRAWLKKPFVDLLRRHKVALTLVDQAWMPMGDELAETLDPLTVEWGYIRLLGDRKEIEEITTSWDKEVIDRSDRIERWATFLAEQRGRAERLLVYSNNHYAGHSPATIQRLRKAYAEAIGAG